MSTQPTTHTTEWEPWVPQIKGSEQPNLPAKAGAVLFVTFQQQAQAFNPATEYNQHNLECSADRIIPHSALSLSTLPHNYRECGVGIFYAF